MGYAGFLSVPPILGFVGHAFDLSIMLTLVALMGVMVRGAVAGRPCAAADKAETGRQPGGAIGK